MREDVLIAAIKEIANMLDESPETRIMIIHQLLSKYEDSKQSAPDIKDSRATDL